MDGFVSKAIRKKKNFRVVPSTGAQEDASRAREVDAYDKDEAEKKYRRQMKGAVHPLEPVFVYLVPDKDQDKKLKGKAEWLQR